MEEACRRDLLLSLRFPQGDMWHVMANMERAVRHDLLRSWKSNAGAPECSVHAYLTGPCGRHAPACRW
eukprot:955940-Pelagomonas_calceolata.AAC.1